MTARILIKDLAATPEGPVTVSGWVETVRDQKKVQFVVLRDETGAAQLVHPVPEERDAIADVISGLAQGTFLTVTGELKLDERVKLGGLEVKVADIEIAAAAIPETPIAAEPMTTKPSEAMPKMTARIGMEKRTESGQAARMPPRMMTMPR